MSVTRPTQVPRWDTNKTNVSTPAAGQLTDGYAAGDAPSAADFNWLMHYNSAYAAYLRNILYTSLAPPQLLGGTASGPGPCVFWQPDLERWGAVDSAGNLRMSYGGYEWQLVAATALSSRTIESNHPFAYNPNLSEYVVAGRSNGCHTATSSTLASWTNKAFGGASSNSVVFDDTTDRFVFPQAAGAVRYFSTVAGSVSIVTPGFAGNGVDIAGNPSGVLVLVSDAGAVWWSTNGGTNWTNATTAFEAAHSGSVAATKRYMVDYDADTGYFYIYSATIRALFRSTNGVAWTEVIAGSAEDTGLTLRAFRASSGFLYVADYKATIGMQRVCAVDLWVPTLSYQVIHQVEQVIVDGTFSEGYHMTASPRGMLLMRKKDDGGTNLNTSITARHY